MGEEIWKPIKGYEELYLISSHGRIWSNLSNRILKGGNSHGYPDVILSNDGEKGRFRIHRLVAQTFIPNPNNLPCVNHKDETRDNNYVDNLEWCTYEYNNNYGTKGERISKSNKGKKRSEEFKEDYKKYRRGNHCCAKEVVCDNKIFLCQTDCAEYYGVKQQTMSSWLLKKRPMPIKYINLGLRFLDDENFIPKYPNLKYKTICDGIIYDNVTECAEYYNIKPHNMQRWLKGKHKMPQKFIDLKLQYYNDECCI